MSASPYDFWAMPGHCGSCKIAAAENYRRMKKEHPKGYEMTGSSELTNNRMFIFGSGLVIGAVMMHLLMHRK